MIDLTLSIHWDAPLQESTTSINQSDLDDVDYDDKFQVSS